MPGGHPGVVLWFGALMVLGLACPWRTPEPPLPPAGRPTPSEGACRRWRLILSLAAGLTVTILALLSAWRGVGTHENFQYQQPRTRWLLRRIDSAIQAYMEKTGRPPSTLGELDAVKEGSYLVDPDGAVRDGWNQPFRYSVDGGKYLVVSYGRDGKPGGRGLDCDLSNVSPAPPESLPTFGQFLFDLPTGGLVWTSVLSGMVVFLLAFFTIKNDLYAGMPVSIAIKLVVMAIAALLFASFISFLHIPTGH
ncbi:MAG: hypothetical protein FJ290_17110 [Planctomycetes bacterium]|nr:hypothetical protein [Planctomycetota bacterium]